MKRTGSAGAISLSVTPTAGFAADNPITGYPSRVRLSVRRAAADALSPAQTVAISPFDPILPMPSVLLTDDRSTPLQPTADIPTSPCFPQTILRATIASRCSKVLTCRPSLNSANSPPTLTGLLILLLT